MEIDNQNFEVNYLQNTDEPLSEQIIRESASEITTKIMTQKRIPVVSVETEN